MFDDLIKFKNGKPIIGDMLITIPDSLIMVCDAEVLPRRGFVFTDADHSILIDVETDHYVGSAKDNIKNDLLEGSYTYHAEKELSTDYVSGYYITYEDKQDSYCEIHFENDGNEHLSIVIHSEVEDYRPDELFELKEVKELINGLRKVG